MDEQEQLYRDAIMILQVLYDDGLSSEFEVTDADSILLLSGLDEEPFQRALLFLRSRNRQFVVGDGDEYYATQAGLDFLERYLRRGENLPLHRGVLERAVAIQERTQRILAEARRLHDEGVPAVLVREQAEVNVVLGELRTQLEKLPPPRKPRNRRGKVRDET